MIRIAYFVAGVLTTILLLDWVRLQVENERLRGLAQRSAEVAEAHYAINVSCLGALARAVENTHRPHPERPVGMGAQWREALWTLPGRGSSERPELPQLGLDVAEGQRLPER